MHEAGLMRNLMLQIAETAATEGATRVTAVRIWLGALSHFSEQHFRAHYAEAARGTPAEQATLEIEISDDIHDPRAQGIVLRSIAVEDQDTHS